MDNRKKKEEACTCTKARVGTCTKARGSAPSNSWKTYSSCCAPEPQTGAAQPQTGAAEPQTGAPEPQTCATLSSCFSAIVLVCVLWCRSETKMQARL